MVTLQIEHAIKDFGMWKAAFDRDPIDRRGLGVLRHRIFRPVDDPAYVVVELEFATQAQAWAGLESLHRLWDDGQAAPALVGAPRTHILETVEDEGY